MVTVSNDEGKIEISQAVGTKPISISIDPGRHRLKVEKDGFRFFAQNFTMESGGELEIKATLLPKAGQVAARGAKNRPLAFDDPAFQQWMKDIATLTAAKQVEAVSKKLMELNPGFDGKITPSFEGRLVTELTFLTDNVRE